MNTFDIILLVFACVLVVVGMFKGLVRILLGLAALVAAFALAARYHEGLADRLGGVDISIEALRLVAYLLIFIGVMLAGGLVAFFARRLLQGRDARLGRPSGRGGPRVRGRDARGGARRASRGRLLTLRRTGAGALDPGPVRHRRCRDRDLRRARGSVRALQGKDRGPAPLLAATVHRGPEPAIPARCDSAPRRRAS